MAVKSMAQAAEKALEMADLKREDIDIVIPHQANIRIINALAKKLNVPMEKVFINLDRYGNTSASSIPIAIYDAAKENKFKKGDLCLFVAFGAGLTWGSTIMRF